ncbi:hypothetical protein HK099_001581 [Clydaea vesicula]|uniref:Uncharacterized protein n=1 Tax=Clydaea vesicula TaxID=447962 RepID=A0AAD5XZM6_9FUNG|nr:hypothetical protein HK099_001581 [Clydaea vesicula]KAJ3397150.1 hypothetical protein HDU92_000455 [Lobulomyces angularis]
MNTTAKAEKELPKRFKSPQTWKYPHVNQHPLFTTTSNGYGLNKPSVQEMPKDFHGMSSKFSEHLNHAGPFRNFSLNMKFD